MQNPKPSSDLHINVVVSPEDERRIREEESKWTAPRLIALLLVTLAIALAVLYGLASTSS